MPFLKNFVIALLLLMGAQLSVISAEKSPDARFAEATAAFEKGDFNGVHALADGLISDGHLSPQLFQLLAQTHYRKGDLGRAALWYERAALFPPPSAEIRQNIDHIRERTGNVVFPANSFQEQFSSWFSRSQWMTFGIISVWVFIFAVAIYHLFVKSPSLRVWLMFVRVFALVIATITLLGWYWHPSYDKIKDIVFITSTGAISYTAATSTSGTVMSLPPGSEVRKLEERGDWSYIEIPIDEDTVKRGWISTASFTPFWPYSASYLD